MANSDIRRQLGGMPTGSYNMQDMAFSVREVKPPKIEEEPSTVPSYDLEYDGVICVRQPYQDLEEAVERWFKYEEQQKKIDALKREMMAHGILRPNNDG